MTNKQIARALTETSALIELTGGNEFRARAFANAARTIERMPDQALDLLERGELATIRGIGQGLASQISELVETGSFDVRDELIGSIPPGVLEMLRLKGVGAKKARTIWQTLNVTSIDELESTATRGDLADLPGFGAKTQDKILTSIRDYQRFSTSRRYATVMREVGPLLEEIRAMPGVESASVTGGLRRKLETVTMADILVVGESVSVSEDFAGILQLSGSEVLDDGIEIFTAELHDGFPLNVYVCEPDIAGSAQFRLTGSAEFLEAWSEEHAATTLMADEADVFRSAAIPYIAPELREARGEIDAARENRLPALISVADLKGSIHNHSTYSDGAHTLREMVDAALEMGLEYFAICDHSRSLTIANGLSVERVAEQQAEIHALNAGFASRGESFRILSGIESDILKDGSLDYPDDVLASFDLIVASVHSGFNMSEDEATRRIIRAIENPHTTILGHMTGRLLLSRDGYPVDHLRIIDACAANGVAIELNANPYRLDMDWRYIRAATDRGVMISINPDAHSVDELHYVYWGVEAARKGWLEASQCLNAMPLESLLDWLGTRTARMINS
jgi:DNA polymerase (family X)